MTATTEKPAESTWDFKDWYRREDEAGKTNGQTLNELRKNKYKTDPEYKKRVLAENRKSRDRIRQQREQERAKEWEAKKAKPAKLWKETTIEISGVPTVLQSIGALAASLGRSKLSVRQLERRGVIPETPHKTEQGERLYSPEQIVEIRKILQEKGRLEPKRVTIAPECMTCRVQFSDGKVRTVPVFRVGAVAKAIGKSTITLEQLERRGTIPATPLRTHANRRVYILEQVEAIRDALETRSGNLRAAPNGVTLAAELASAWKALKLDGAKLVEILPVKDGE